MLPRCLTPLLTLPLAASAWAQFVTADLPDRAQEGEIVASSAAGRPGAKYGPQEAVDGRPETWWAADNRVPQWLAITLPEAREIDTIVLLNANNRPLYTNASRVTIAFAAGPSVQQDLPDELGPHVIRLPGRTTQSLTVTIDAVHEPEKRYLGLAMVGLFHDPDRRVRMKTAPIEAWKAIDLTETPRLRHPCVYLTPESVAAARQRVREEAWAAERAKAIIRQADQALERTDEWYLAMLPAKGAAFAYGLTGCPICKASWGTWGGARCTWDNPGHVTCANGHVLPDDDHPDEGTGYRNPDGRIHYFVGSWKIGRAHV